MRKGLLWGFISTAFIVLLSIAIIDALKGNLTSTDGTMFTRTLTSLLSYFESLDFVPVEWFARYYELGTWPSWINWLLTIAEILMTILNYTITLILLAFQALVFVLGFLAWVFA